MDFFVSKGAPNPVKKAAAKAAPKMKQKNDKKEMKRFVLTTKQDDFWVPMTQNEINGLLAKLETEDPVTYRVLKQIPGALDQLAVPELPDHIPIYDHWEKAAKRILLGHFYHVETGRLLDFPCSSRRQSLED